jgi:mono/diheme cytochrome c family protein
MMIKVRLLLLAFTLIVLSGCSDEQDTYSGTNISGLMQDTKLQTERWYSQSQVIKGNELYQQNCASCHKPDASGTKKWRKTNPDGKFPPPPLNGAAHTWHHSLSVLTRIVRDGGMSLGGVMPGFGGKLSKEEIVSILAWIQSKWSDEIYSIWYKRTVEPNNQEKTPIKG